MLEKNTYMAEDGRFWPFLAKRENVRTIGGLRRFSEMSDFFQTDALDSI